MKVKHFEVAAAVMQVLSRGAHDNGGVGEIAQHAVKIEPRAAARPIEVGVRAHAQPAARQDFGVVAPARVGQAAGIEKLKPAGALCPSDPTLFFRAGRISASHSYCHILLILLQRHVLMCYFLSAHNNDGGLCY